LNTLDKKGFKKRHLVFSFPEEKLGLDERDRAHHLTSRFMVMALSRVSRV
jgi:hypothetical protein